MPVNGVTSEVRRLGCERRVPKLDRRRNFRGILSPPRIFGIGLTKGAFTPARRCASSVLLLHLWRASSFIERVRPSRLAAGGRERRTRSASPRLARAPTIRRHVCAKSTAYAATSDSLRQFVSPRRASVDRRAGAIPRRRSAAAVREAGDPDGRPVFSKAWKA